MRSSNSGVTEAAVRYRRALALAIAKTARDVSRADASHVQMKAIRLLAVMVCELTAVESRLHPCSSLLLPDTPWRPRAGSASTTAGVSTGKPSKRKSVPQSPQ